MPLVAICSVKCREIFIPPWQESVPCGSQVLGPELIAGQKNATTVKVAIENSESAQNDRATIGQIEELDAGTFFEITGRWEAVKPHFHQPVAFGTKNVTSPAP